MERTATAPVEVRISEVVGRAFLGLASVGGSMSISVDAILRVVEGREAGFVVLWMVVDSYFEFDMFR